jgi:hypothetical protein
VTARVSVGPDIRRPGLLSAEPIGTILTGIGGGRWAEPITRLRTLPYHSADFAAEKEQLAYWTPSGLFRYRNATGLVQHSGHVAIDLDNLGAQGATKAIQGAVEDAHCLCAFRSASGQGCRLVFRCPPSAPAHRAIFNRVANHVRAHYGVKPDSSGSDVSRACFVSYDNGMWLNPSAAMLPGLADLANQCQVSNNTQGPYPCVLVGGLSEGDRVTLAWGLGESRAPHDVREDGMLATHLSLRDLARDLVVRYRRHDLALTQADVQHAFQGWLDTGKRHGRLRHKAQDYLGELTKAVCCVKRWNRLPYLVSFWPRWTEEPDFPATGTAEERLEYAIRRHCETQGTTRFYLSARDAATITGTNASNANQALHRLLNAKVLTKVGKRRQARHAQTYRLTTKDGPSRLPHVATA